VSSSAKAKTDKGAVLPHDRTRKALRLRGFEASRKWDWDWELVVVRSKGLTLKGFNYVKCANISVYTGKAR
jgi:hypothetical protein